MSLPRAMAACHWLRCLWNAGLLGRDPEAGCMVEDLCAFVEGEMLSVPGISHAAMDEYQSRVESDRQAGLRVIAELRAENARLREQCGAVEWKCSQCDGEGTWMEPAPVGVIPCPACGGKGRQTRYDVTGAVRAENQRLTARVAELETLVGSLSDRVAKQCDLLSKVAERKAA